MNTVKTIYVTFAANKSRGGLYLKALCLGLEDVLKPYRQALLKLEKELLEDPHLTPAYIQGILEQVLIDWWSD